MARQGRTGDRGSAVRLAGGVAQFKGAKYLTGIGDNPDLFLIYQQNSINRPNLTFFSQQTDTLRALIYSKKVFARYPGLHHDVDPDQTIV